MIKTHERIIITAEDGTELLVEYDTARSDRVDLTIRVDDEVSVEWDVLDADGYLVLNQLCDALGRVKSLADQRRQRRRESFSARPDGRSQDPSMLSTMDAPTPV